LHVGRHEGPGGRVGVERRDIRGLGPPGGARCRAAARASRLATAQPCSRCGRDVARSMRP
jgi:hypothetical protein